MKEMLLFGIPKSAFYIHPSRIRFMCVSHTHIQLYTPKSTLDTSGNHASFGITRLTSKHAQYPKVQFFVWKAADDHLNTSAILISRSIPIRHSYSLCHNQICSLQLCFEGDISYWIIHPALLSGNCTFFAESTTSCLPLLPLPTGHLRALFL